jgi:predicted NBD/HSP70 family sugar kinase
MSGAGPSRHRVAADGDGRGRPALLRTINQRALLEHLRHVGTASRAELARRSGLSKPTVSEALAELEAAGLVRPAGSPPPARGRTPALYELDPTAAYVVGIDIGRAYVRIAAADLSGDVVARQDRRNRARSAATLVRAVADDAHEVVAGAGLSWADVAHTVVGSPGVFDPATGRLRHAPNLPGWSRPGLVDELRAELATSIAVENDVNLAAMGELAHGHGRAAPTFAYLSVGTGIGLGIVIDGALYRGAHGAAGEVAFLPLDGAGGQGPGGRPAPDTRLRGILEEAASADAVVRAARELGVEHASSAKRVFAAARAGEAAARAVVRAEAERLALVVATVVAVVDPQLVVLGGGVGRNLDVLRPVLEARLRELVPLSAEVVESELGQDAVVLGAIAAALETARELVFRRAAAGRLAG